MKEKRAQQIVTHNMHPVPLKLILALLMLAAVLSACSASEWTKEDIHKQTGTIYDLDGSTRAGYGPDGYDRDGYDRNGYDRAGNNRAYNEHVRTMESLEDLEDGVNYKDNDVSTILK